MFLGAIKSEQKKIFEKIAVMKALAIGRRGTFKDYIDLYFILKEKFVSLQNLITLCIKKYKDEFNERLFLEQLIYVEEAEEVPIVFFQKPPTKKEMAEFFKKEIKKLKI